MLEISALKNVECTRYLYTYLLAVVGIVNPIHYNSLAT